MNKEFGIDHRSGKFRKAIMFLVAASLLLANISSAAAQKDKKKKKDEAKTADNSKTVLLSDEQQIDYRLSEMLGAWQVGDIEKLHSMYADDVSLVNAAWAPPVIGWANYLAIYQQQRARMQRVRMDRSNTYIKVNGNTGWACYQWDFSADVDGRPVQSQGQTTVVLEKRNNQWVIVHNHTSLSPGSQQPSPANTTTPQQTPAKPNGL
ncbi:MAG TPA: nuclear transport factor 2 family protein [Candidatus Acidoferrum sp.]